MIIHSNRRDHGVTFDRYREMLRESSDPQALYDGLKSEISNPIIETSYEWKA